MFQLDSSQTEYRKNCRIHIVDDYALGAALGEGSYAKVKEGIDIRSKTLIAIKIYSRVKLRSLENGEVMVQREVSLMRSLHHPNIVNVRDDFMIEEKEKMYIVMDYVNGGTLQDLLDRAPDKKLPLCQCQRIMKGLIKGLIYLQTNGIVHRDLKPDNILLNTDEVVKIGDFGTAVRITPSNEIENCFHGEGSPAYQPPENTNNSKWKKNPMKLDIWSLGIVLFVMAIGRYPFENPNPITLFENISHGEYELPPNTNSLLQDLIQGMIQVDVEKRLSAKSVKKHSFLTTHMKSESKKEVPMLELTTVFDSKTIENVMKSVKERDADLDEHKKQRCMIM